MSAPSDDVTQLVGAWASGDVSARDRLIPLVYGELRGLAGSYLRRERSGHTLQPTALVHEAFLRFNGQGAVPVACRGQFMGLIAQTMRHVLVDHARRRDSNKRGSGATHVPLEEALDGSAAPQHSVLALDDVLTRLSVMDARQAQIVELRVFGGFEVKEVAEILAISPATVKREWVIAKAWLHRELRG